MVAVCQKHISYVSVYEFRPCNNGDVLNGHNYYWDPWEAYGMSGRV